MTEQGLKTLNPFDIPPAPRFNETDTERADRIGAKNGFDVPPAKPIAAQSLAAKPKPKPRKKPKPKPPAVRRMRRQTAEPKAQFNQRVPVYVANGFYDYQRETGLPMGTVLQKAYEALMEVNKDGT